ncbi:MAG: phage major capsid protein, partial [Sedimentisphaerales bacterium]|nr:phage major capsid protein [Sedimentisphaerales bacterium]
VYCLEAGVAPTASNIGFGSGGLSPKNWISYIPVPRSTMESAAIAIGEVVGRRLARAFGRKEDACGFMGDGSSTYFNYIGLTQALLRVNTTPSKVLGLQVQATAGTWAAIVTGDITGMQGRVHDDADDGVDLKWYCHKNFYYTVLLRIALGLGGVTASEMINTAYGRNPMFLGRPVEFSPPFAKVKPAVDHVPLLYGNLRMAAILGEARAYSLASDASVFFTSDSIAIRATERIGMNNETGVGNSTDEAEADQEEGCVVGLYADIA